MWLRGQRRREMLWGSWSCRIIWTSGGTSSNTICARTESNPISELVDACLYVLEFDAGVMEVAVSHRRRDIENVDPGLEVEFVPQLGPVCQ